MDFIYHGEVNIYQEDLDAFLALAEELKLQGLDDSQTKEEPPNEIMQELSNPRIAKETNEPQYFEQKTKPGELMIIVNTME